MTFQQVPFVYCCVMLVYNYLPSFDEIPGLSFLAFFLDILATKKERNNITKKCSIFIIIIMFNKFIFIYIFIKTMKKLETVINKKLK